MKETRSKVARLASVPAYSSSDYPFSAALIAEIKLEFPKFRIVPKKARKLQTAIHHLLRAVTLGSQDRYLSHYHTVMGDTLYVPGIWASSSDTSRTILLRHERVHLRQRRRYGSLLFAAIYLFPLLPMGLAYGRARLEWEAYRETLRATAEFCGAERLYQPAFRRDLIARFTGGDYGWMWPFPRTIGRWFDEAVRELSTGPKSDSSR